MPPGTHPSALLLSARTHAARRGVRYISKSPTQNTTLAPIAPLSVSVPTVPSVFLPSPSHHRHHGKQPSLSVLPFQNVLRTYLITTMSSSPVMLNACLSALNVMLKSNSWVLNPEKNRYLGWLFRKTFYDQFCGGENKTEVQLTSDSVKSLGYNGIIHEYCLEVLDRGLEDTDGTDATTLQEIGKWRSGMLDTLAMASPRDFVALKWSGLGAYALTLLKNDRPPTPAMAKAMEEICDVAYEKQIRLLPGAEWEQTNVGIDSWTLDLQRRYNRSESKGAIVWNTYQAYLRSTPAKLADHLATASREGWIPGVKLVRGAYLSSEPRHLIWATKEDTDKAYDDILEGLMRRTTYGLFTSNPDAGPQPLPHLEIVLATHNHESVRRATSIRHAQIAQLGSPGAFTPVPLTFAQLYGMADDLSCSILETLKRQDQSTVATSVDSATARQYQPQIFKSVSWGTMNECLHFLHRRATENMDAAMRTEDTRKAMGQELWRRFVGVWTGSAPSSSS